MLVLGRPCFAEKWYNIGVLWERKPKKIWLWDIRLHTPRGESLCASSGTMRRRSFASLGRSQNATTKSPTRARARSVVVFSWSFELEFENGIGDCWVRGFGRFEMGREGEI